MIRFRSATGKSTLLKQLATSIPKQSHLYLVNVKGEETSFYEKIHKKTFTINYAGIKSAKKNSVIIVEDVISMKKEEEINLRNAINYTVHHNRSKLFCVSHTITKTGLYSMVGLFNYIIFTGSPSNLPVIRTCLRYFKIETPIVDKWLTCIKKESKKLAGSWNPYYFFDCTKMIFCMTYDLAVPKTYKLLGSLEEESSSSNDDDDDYTDDDDDDNNVHLIRRLSSEAPPLSAGFGSAQPAFGGQLAGAPTHATGSKNKRPPNKGAKRQPHQFSTNLMVHQQPGSRSRELAKKEEKKRQIRRERKIEQLRKKFSGFFSGHELHHQANAIFSIIAEKVNIDSIDSSDLSIKFRSSRGVKKISLVDYIACLLIPDRPPSLDHLVLHNFVSRHCLLPVSCIRNKHFVTRK